jgi:Protein of unknown function (DUF2867)
MAVVKCDVPTISVLDRRLVDAAYFKDAYRAPVRLSPMSVISIFQAIFAHYPMWIKVVLITRNWLAALCGLDAPTTAEIMHFQSKSSYKVGDKIGAWPIFYLSETELVAGRDDKHLDFRLSIVKETDGQTTSAVVSTICTVHNVYGKVYLFFIVPFHKWGVQKLINRAIDAQRL